MTALAHALETQRTHIARNRSMPNLGDRVKFTADGLVLFGNVTGISFGVSIDVETADATTFQNIREWEILE